MPYPYDKDSPEITGAMKRVTDANGTRRELAYKTEQERIDAAANWNKGEEDGEAFTVERLFEKEALRRVSLVDEEFAEPGVMTMFRSGIRSTAYTTKMTTAMAIWTYWKTEAYPRLIGRGHTKLTPAQLRTVAGQVGDALPFLGVDGSDTGWP